jgi:hypothetical protein
MPGAFGSQPPTIAPQAIPAASMVAFDNGSALAVAPRMESANAALDVDAIREAVMAAMETGGSQMLVHALEEGQWTAEGSQVSAKVEMSDGMIELSYTREQERLSAEAATRVAGRAVKVRLVGGTTASATVKPRASGTARAGGTESIKTRAADEPVVKRMMEKFGAEIRIVMDRSER